MKNVLIVDDEKSLLLSLKAGFDAYKDRFKIFTVEDGKKAVEILNTHPIDLVVTDVRMPEMDGFELLVYMNTQFPSIPALVMSAYGTREIEGKFESIGIIGFLDKPVDFDELVKSIEDGLNRTSHGGTMTGFSVGSFLQLIEMEEKTCLLEVNSKGKKGLFYFHKGLLFDAVGGGMIGEEAAINMIMWDQVTISFKSLPEKKIMRRINSELMPIMMEASRRKDEKLQENELGLFDGSFEDELNSLEKEIGTLKEEEEDSFLAQEPLEIDFPEISASLDTKPIISQLQEPVRIPEKPQNDIFVQMAKEMQGLKMIGLMDTDGIMISEHNPANLSTDVFAAKLAMVIGITDQMLREFKGVGELEETIIQTGNAWLVCRHVVNTVYLGLVIGKESTLGNIRLVIGKYMDKVHQLLP